MLSEKFRNLYPISLKEIASELQISESTLRRKRKSANLDIPRGLVCPKDLVQILKLFYSEKMLREASLIEDDYS